eukprot:644335-Pelagomonas_calceolata.AAC.3
MGTTRVATPGPPQAPILFLSKGMTNMPLNLLANSWRKKAYAVKTLPTSIKKKRIPRAEAASIPPTKRKGKNQWGPGGLLAVPVADLSDE